MTTRSTTRTRAAAAMTAAALTLGLAASALAAPAAQASGPAAAEKPRKTDIALKATGFGSRVTGGQVPTESDETAFMVISCTTRAPVDKQNHEVEANLPGLGTASNVRTDTWTRQRGGTVSSFSRNTIEKVVVADSGLGSIEINAVTSFARAWHDNSGFHATARTSVGSIVLVPPGGAEPQELEIPSPGQPLEIPGIATITLGATTETANANRAFAQANALIIDRTAPSTRTKISQVKTQAYDGVENGTFHGFSAATQANVGDGTVTSGRTPLSLMPCQGTDGKVLSKKASDSDLGGSLLATGLTASQKAWNRGKRAIGWERGSVAHVSLGGGELDIDGIIGKARVVRQGKKVTTSIKGSTVGTITAGGEEQEFPDTGVLEIPGVAKLERFVTEKVPGGIHLVALRITLLDGGAVVDLGQARMQIRRN